jgi:hypothetical protein
MEVGMVGTSVCRSVPSVLCDDNSVVTEFMVRHGWHPRLQVGAFSVAVEWSMLAPVREGIPLRRMHVGTSRRQETP